MSFLQGVVPSQFKIARVIPVHKKASFKQLNNFCPISLLPVFDRILEKLMYKRLINYVEKFKTLTDNQFGFRNTIDLLLIAETVVLNKYIHNQH